MTAHDLIALARSIPYLEAHMNRLTNLEPVRLYSIAAAALALLAYYVTIPVGLILALVAAVLGVGEGVRSKVTPNERVIASYNGSTLP